MRKTQIVVGLVIASALSHSVAEEAPVREFSFVLKICEAPKFKMLFNDQTKERWLDCDIPLPDVPVIAVTEGGDRFEGKTDDQGIAKIPSIHLDASEKARLFMACTTHRCLSLHDLFPGNNIFKYGENRILVYTPKQVKQSQG